jgi:cyclic beta-1,2-glucan synthetase
VKPRDSRYPPVRDWIARANAAAGIWGYLGTIAVVTAVIDADGLLTIGGARVGGWIRYILAMLAIIPAMDAAVAIVNRAVTTAIGPAMIPALELHDGVPPNLRAMVVMPTLSTTPTEIDEQIEHLWPLTFATARSRGPALYDRNLLLGFVVALSTGDPAIPQAL